MMIFEHSTIPVNFKLLRPLPSTI